MVSEEISPLLAEASLRQIWVELAKRFDITIFAGATNTQSPQEQFRMFYSGGVFPAIGLARALQTEVLKRVLNAGPIINPEDKV